VDHDPDWGDLRLTVDTPEDLELARRIYALFGNTSDFDMEGIVSLLAAHPELSEINANIQHKSFKDVDQRG
jgi:spore coat polysaccharide biosynthesis protein SpsF